MENITYKNRTFKIVDKKPIEVYPNTAKRFPLVAFTFIAEGKRGAFISGYITKDNKTIIISE